MFNKLKFLLFVIVAFNVSNTKTHGNEYVLQNNNDTIIVPVEDDRFLQKDYIIPPIGIGKKQSIMLNQLKEAGISSFIRMKVENFCNLSFKLSNEFSLMLFINEPYINNPCIFNEIYQQKILSSIIHANMSSFEYNGNSSITIEQFFNYLSNKTYLMALKTMSNIQSTVFNTHEIEQIENVIKIQLNSYIDNIKLTISELKSVIINYLCMYYNFNTDNVFINNTMKSLVYLQQQINTND